MKLKDWQKIKLFDPCLAALRQENVALCAGATGSGKSCIAMELIKAVEKPALRGTKVHYHSDEAHRRSLGCAAAGRGQH